MTRPRILIVEDDKKIAELLKDYMEQAGFKVSILLSGEHVVDNVRIDPPDIILLDLMLPVKDGISICREVRCFSKVPILMLTAKVEEIDRLLGLELGADDYICKPFSPREVVARVRAVLRRIKSDTTYEKVVTGPIEINAENHKAIVMGADLNLTPKEFELLKAMMSSPGRVFTRDDLVSKIQGYGFDGYERTIDSHIKNLRKKISDHMPGKKVIHTVYGIGYRLSVPQSEATDTPES